MDALSLNWVGGEHDFALRIGELRGLQTSTDKGPEEIFIGLRTGAWKIDEVVQVLRFGLMGGGMTKADATSLVMGVIDLHPLAQMKMTALAVLGHSILGPMDDRVGEEEGETESLPANSSSPASTETEPS